jgi:hypothetical protein
MREPKARLSIENARTTVAADLSISPAAYPPLPLPASRLRPQVEITSRTDARSQTDAQSLADTTLDVRLPKAQRT